jgi:hypothetical protein
VSGDLVQAIADGADLALRDGASISRNWSRDERALVVPTGGATAWEYLYLFVSATDFAGREVVRIDAVASDVLYERRQDAEGLGPLLRAIVRDEWQVLEWEYGIGAGRRGALESFRFDAVFDRPRTGGDHGPHRAGAAR